MKVTVLGSASGMAVPHRNPSSYLVESDHRLYLIDTGDGVAQQLVRLGIDHNRINSVFISHTHPDHAAGLFMLLQLMHLTGRKTPLHIYLPQGVLPGFNSIFPFFQIFREKWPFRFELLPISSGIVLEKNGFRLSAILNSHLSGNNLIAEKFGMKSDSYSFLFSNRKNGTVIYTSDIDSFDYLKGISSRVDLLISECYHLDIEEIINFAHETSISRVVLTHIPPELEGISIPKKSPYDSIKVSLASDGYVIEV